MATRGKPSVFAAFSQMRVRENFDSEDDSAEERQQERKEKQKQRKKSRSKKNSRHDYYCDSAQLKDLAFVSASKPRKSKSKSKNCKTGTKAPPHSSSGTSIEKISASNGESDEREAINACESSIADVTRSTLEPQKVMSPLKQQQLQNLTPSPVQPAYPSAPSGSQSLSEIELGAVYTPSHIKITRVDGQMERMVSVTDVMDQLLRYTQQNTQLLIIQEQLGHANRNLQDQLQRSAELISGLQNEVAMFRQMCLNLQAEVSFLRSNTVQIAPDAGTTPQSQHHHRPPPGMA